MRLIGWSKQVGRFSRGKVQKELWGKKFLRGSKERKSATTIVLTNRPQRRRKRRKKQKKKRGEALKVSHSQFYICENWPMEGKNLRQLVSSAPPIIPRKQAAWQSETVSGILSADWRPAGGGGEKKTHEPNKQKKVFFFFFKVCVWVLEQQQQLLRPS